MPSARPPRDDQQPRHSTSGDVVAEASSSEAGGGLRRRRFDFDERPDSSSAPVSFADDTTSNPRSGAVGDDEENDHNDDDFGTTSTTVAGTADTFTTATSILTTSTAHPQSSGPRHHQHVGGVTDLALQAFQDALEWVEPSQRAEYSRARALCPESVLQHECCPCYFLVACLHNPWEAAAKMCRYWSERIDLFEDRAFQALTLGSEAGAPPTGLTEEDVRVWHSGCVTVLPPDRTGRSVIAYDEGRIDWKMLELTKSRMRCLWYATLVAYTGGHALSHRLVVLVNGQRYDRHPIRPAVRRMAVACRKLPPALPIIIESVNLLSRSSTFGTGTVLQYLWSATLELAGGCMSGLFKMHHGTAGRTTTDPHRADAESRADLMAKLRGLGFTKRGVPDWAGGLLTLEDFRLWTKQRQRKERRELWTDEQHSQHRRTISRVNSKKKRQRRHQELQALQDKADRLRDANARAKWLGQQLETLIGEANDVVVLASIPHDGGASWTRGDEPYPAATTRTADCQLFTAPDVDIDDFPPDVLASLEPDPIAPHCLPMGVASPDRGHQPLLFSPALHSAGLEGLGRIGLAGEVSYPFDLPNINPTPLGPGVGAGAPTGPMSEEGPSLPTGASSALDALLQRKIAAGSRAYHHLPSPGDAVAAASAAASSSVTAAPSLVPHVGVGRPHPHQCLAPPSSIERLIAGATAIPRTRIGLPTDDEDLTCGLWSTNDYVSHCPQGSASISTPAAAAADDDHQQHRDASMVRAKPLEFSSPTVSPWPWQWPWQPPSSPPPLTDTAPVRPDDPVDDFRWDL